MRVRVWQTLHLVFDAYANCTHSLPLPFRYFNLRMKRDTTIFSPDLIIEISGDETPVDTSHIYSGEIFGKFSFFHTSWSEGQRLQSEFLWYNYGAFIFELNWKSASSFLIVSSWDYPSNDLYSDKYFNWGILFLSEALQNIVCVLCCIYHITNQHTQGLLLPFILFFPSARNPFPSCCTSPAEFKWTREKQPVCLSCCDRCLWNKEKGNRDKEVHRYPLFQLRNRFVGAADFSLLQDIYNLLLCF